MVPTELRYTNDHEWVRVDGDEATIGITAYAADQLGDIVFVELPDVGRPLEQFAAFGVVESVKAASEVYAPASGEVTAVNAGLADDPARVNADAMGEGWFYKIKLANAKELGDLMDEAAYQAFTAAQDKH